jgi:hypothetical protein
MAAFVAAFVLAAKFTEASYETPSIAPYEAAASHSVAFGPRTGEVAAGRRLQLTKF